MAHHLEVGHQGEDIAVHYLRKHGYKIRERNVHLGRDEIDIIAFDRAEKVLVFAEVKARSRDDPDFHPLLNVTWSKKQKLRRSARRWVERQEYEGGYRVDLVCVAGGCVTNHIRQVEWER